MLARNGSLADMLGAGARILESACGPCIGMGQSPKTNAVSVRTNNRNFYARSGTASAGIYLTSCETAAVTALTGVLTDPRTLDIDLTVEQPAQFEVNDNLVIPPAAEGQEDAVEVVRGPNIKPFPLGHELEDSVSGKVLLKMEDNITTDHIMPSNAKLLPYRSNIPHLADFCLTPVDESFPARAKAEQGGILVAGANYGQGSSREHAALVPLYLGIRAVAAKSFARIHQANLINNGILPLTFVNEADYDKIEQMDVLSLPDVRAKIEAQEEILILRNDTRGENYRVRLPLTDRQRGMILAGGLINFIRTKG
jgi:aconitate hydratase